MAKNSKKSGKAIEELTREELSSITTIGNDVSDRQTRYCCVDVKGKVVAEGQVRTRAQELQAFYSKITPVRVVLETGTHSPWMSRLIAAAGHEVIVANSRELHVIFKSKKKTDRVDARTLAKLGQFDLELLHPVHHRSAQVQQDLALLRARDILIKSRTGLINFCRGIVKTMGERLPSCSAEAFAKKITPHVPEDLRVVLTPILTQIEQLTMQIHGHDKQITTLLETRYPESRWVTQINGVGPITAFAYMLLIESAERFQKSRSVGAYFGLVPRVADSGDTQSQLRITKQGDTLMRKLLVNAAHYILGPFGIDSDLRRSGQQIAVRGGKNAKKRAAVAVARRLAVVMHRLLRRRETYDPLYNAKRRTVATAA